MRISEYKRALAPIPENELDSFIATHSEASVHFEPANSPPARWTQILGSVTCAPGKETRADDAGKPDGDAGVTAQHPLFDPRFLVGFKSDLRNKFGDDIAMECVQHCGLSGKTPITARTVKHVIEQAEVKRKAMRTINDYNLKSYFYHDMWAGILMPRGNRQNPGHLNGARIGEPLEKNAAQFVKSLITAKFQNHPEYGKTPIRLEQFVDIAIEVLALYNEIRTLPAMSRQALAMTFAIANVYLPIHNVDTTVRMLPTHAATACLCSNLNPDDSTSLLCQAVRDTQTDPTFPDPSEFALTRIQHEFPDKFDAVKDESKVPDSASCKEVFEQLIELGKFTLRHTLVNYREQQKLIETSTEYSPRLKTMLYRCLDDGLLTQKALNDFIEPGLQLFHHLTDTVLPSLAGDHAAEIFARVLNELAERSLHHYETDGTTDWNRAKITNGKVDEADRKSRIEIFCKFHTLVAACQLSHEDATTLLTALTGEIGSRLLQLLNNKNSLQHFACRALSETLSERVEEVSDSFHAFMASRLDRAVNVTYHPTELTLLPCGHYVSSAFWDALCCSSLVLKYGNGQPCINLDNWDKLDTETKMRRLDDGYRLLLDSTFNGDADKATGLTTSIMTIDPAIQAICTVDSSRNPLRLPNGIRVARLQAFTMQQTITLIDTEHGHLLLKFKQKFSRIHHTEDHEGDLHWIDRKKSQLAYECILRLSPSGHLALQEPMRVALDLVASEWPLDDYPELMPEDLYSPHYDAREDLKNYAASTGNPNHTVVLEALDALQRFRENPSLDNALAVHAQFIASGALACLGDISTETEQSLLAMFDRLNAAPSIEAFNRLVDVLDTLIDGGTDRRHEDSAIAIRNHILLYIGNPTLDRLSLLAEGFLDADSPYANLQEVIPDELLKQLRDALDLALPPLEISIFDALESTIIDFIDKELLPGFIDETYRKAKETSSANT